MIQIAVIVLLLCLSCCAGPAPTLRGVDLSAARIGATRAEIESALHSEVSEIGTASSAVVAYRYSQQAVPGRDPVFEAAMCQPTVAGQLFSCPMMRALMASRVRREQASLPSGQLQVVYDAEERARWVIFASTPKELDDALALIARAECGEPAAARTLARSLASGSRGFPLDRAEAYRWALIAKTIGAGSIGSVEPEALDEHLGARLSPTARETAAAAAAGWSPRSGAGCPNHLRPDDL